MERYKSVFSESNEGLIKNLNQACKIVDISRLKWSDILGKYSWDEAIANCPSGWRLPTVQELYSAGKQNIDQFELNLYWTSSTAGRNVPNAWAVGINKFGVNVNRYMKIHSLYILCVKEI
jgi:hypothetical protein